MTLVSAALPLLIGRQAATKPHLGFILGEGQMYEGSGTVPEHPEVELRLKEAIKGWNCERLDGAKESGMPMLHSLLIQMLFQLLLLFFHLGSWLRSQLCFQHCS